MSNPREAAKQLFIEATKSKVRFPKVWDESKIVQECGTILMLHRSGANFDEESALSELISKYGIIEDSDVKSPVTKKRKSSGGEGDTEESTDKKVKKTEIVAVEENRRIAESIHEMATIYFKNKDPRKGGVFSKAAKALRETEIVVKDKKSAMSLPGVGKGIAGYIEEFLANGSIEKLEQLRAGTA